MSSKKIKMCQMVSRVHSKRGGKLSTTCRFWHWFKLLKKSRSTKFFHKYNIIHHRLFFGSKPDFFVLELGLGLFWFLSNGTTENYWNRKVPVAFCFISQWTQRIFKAKHWPAFVYFGFMFSCQLKIIKHKGLLCPAYHSTETSKIKYSIVSSNGLYQYLLTGWRTNYIYKGQGHATCNCFSEIINSVIIVAGTYLKFVVNDHFQDIFFKRKKPLTFSHGS